MAKLSALIKALYESSDMVNSVSDLSECTDVNKSFIERMFAGTNTFEKADKVFEYLTHDFDVEMLIESLELIRTIRFLDERRRIKETGVSFKISEVEGKTEEEKMTFFNKKMKEAKSV